MMLAGPLFHHPDQIKIPSSMALQMCVLVFFKMSLRADRSALTSVQSVSVDIRADDLQP